MMTFTDAAELSADISTLCLNEKFSDVLLVVDGKKLPAHKAILSARSKHFETLFSDTSEKEITIADVPYDAFAIFLRYVYSGNVRIPSEIDLTLSVLKLAHQYSVKDLESGIATHLKSLISPNNVVAILDAANQHDLPKLRNACHTFVRAQSKS